jgi:TctA family transporter
MTPSLAGVSIYCLTRLVMVSTSPRPAPLGRTRWLSCRVMGVVVIVFGILGYVMRKVKLPAAPLILGLVLGPILETSVRQALTLSLGDPGVFVRRPITQGLMVLLIAALTWPQVKTARQKAKAKEKDKQAS